VPHFRTPITMFRPGRPSVRVTKCKNRWPIFIKFDTCHLFSVSWPGRSLIKIREKKRIRYVTCRAHRWLISLNISECQKHLAPILQTKLKCIIFVVYFRLLSLTAFEIITSIKARCLLYVSPDPLSATGRYIGFCSSGEKCRKPIYRLKRRP
jgi:hypothetical protein